MARATSLSRSVFSALLVIAACSGFVALVTSPSSTDSGGHWQRGSVIALASMGSRSPEPVSTESGPPPASPMVADLYANHCAACHGTAGKGDGPSAFLLYPKPRDFTSGVFRFKSTPEMQYPTDEDLIRIVSNGIPRTAMPGFRDVLTPEEIASLSQYVLSLAPPRSGEAATRSPIPLSQQPEFTPALVDQGRRIYAAMGCALCHGETGKGDGGSSWSLKDDAGWPLPPADFTTGVYKAGSTASDLYRTIMVGVPGTPMPSFRSAMAAGIKVEGVDPGVDMAWALTAYLQSLTADPTVHGRSAGAVIRVISGPDPAMAADPTHSAWRAIEPVRVAVSPLWQRKRFTSFVDIRAVRIEDTIAIALSWPDATANVAAGGVDQFADAGGLMFSLTETIPPLAMGALVNVMNSLTSPAMVNFWQWRADRQINADDQQLNDGPAAGLTLPDMYPFKKGDLSSGPLSEHERTYISAWEVGNPRSDPALQAHPVLEGNAQGIGTLSWQSPDRQDVNGVGRHMDGWWSVTFVRPIPATQALDVNLDVAYSIPVAVAVWDGAAGDRNGTKSISGWHYLSLEPAQRRNDN